MKITKTLYCPLILTHLGSIIQEPLPGKYQVCKSGDELKEHIKEQWKDSTYVDFDRDIIILNPIESFECEEDEFES